MMYILYEAKTDYWLCNVLKSFFRFCFILSWLSKCSDWKKCNCYVWQKEWQDQKTKWTFIWDQQTWTINPDIQHLDWRGTRIRAEAESSSFSGRSCAAKILGVWGFIIHVCLGFFSVCILALQGFENMSLYLPVFEWSEVLWCDHCPCVTSLMARFENSEQHIPAH